MKYDKKHLPPMRDLSRLARSIQFPAPREVISKIARQQNFSDLVADFVSQFPADQTFDTKADFMARCEELEIFIAQEEDMPYEILRSPQD